MCEIICCHPYDDEVDVFRPFQPHFRVVQGLLNHIDTTKPSGGLKIRFQSFTMVLSKVTTFGVAVGATVFAVAVEIEDRPQRH